MAADYSTDNLTERMSRAKDVHSNYIHSCLKAYGERQQWREANRIPSITLCGMGRAGKDTAAEYLCLRTDMVYPGSASWMIVPVMATVIGVSKEQAWEERHQHREFWIAGCHAFRGKDVCMLARMCLGAGDISIGTRGRVELMSALRSKLIDYAVWIDNNRVPSDITVEYGPGDCDLVVPNHGSYRDFYQKLDRLLNMMRASYFSVLHP